MKRGAETKLVHRMIHTELYCSDCWWFFQTWSYNTKRSISIITPWFKVLFKFFQQWEMRGKGRNAGEKTNILAAGDEFRMRGSWHICTSYLRELSKEPFIFWRKHSSLPICIITWWSRLLNLFCSTCKQTRLPT